MIDIFDDLYLVTKYNVWGKAVQALAHTIEDAKSLTETDFGFITSILHHIGFRGSACITRISPDGFYDSDNNLISDAVDYKKGLPVYMVSGWKKGIQASMICNAAGLVHHIDKWRKQGYNKHIALNEISYHGIYLVHGKGERTKLPITTYTGCMCSRDYTPIPYADDIQIIPAHSI